MRLPSLRKGKERLREALGERSGVLEGDVRPGSAMLDGTAARRVRGDGVGVQAAGCRWNADTGARPLVCLRVLPPQRGTGGHGRYPGQRCHLRSVRSTGCEEEEDASERMGEGRGVVMWL